MDTDLISTLISAGVSAGMSIGGSFIAVRILIARLEERLNHMASRIDSHSARLMRLEEPYFTQPPTPRQRQ